MKKTISYLLMLVLIISGSFSYGEDHEGFVAGKIKGGVAGAALAESHLAGNNSQGYLAPLDYEIRMANKEDLKDKDDTYIREFVDGYKLGHKEAYDRVMAGDKPDKESKDDIGKIAKNLGILYGSIDGRKDFESGRNMDLRRSMPRDREIINIFDLRVYPRSEEEIFLENFKIGYEEGYKSAYNEEHLIPIINNIEAGKKEGEKFGLLNGELKGRADYREGRSADTDRNLPTDREIISSYGLNIDYGEYLSGFLEMFRSSYRIGYLKGFREDKNKDLGREESLAYESGNQVGLDKGKIQANLDYLMGLDNRVSRSIASKEAVIKNYNLRSQGDKYIESFLNGYFSGYREGYDTKYKENLLKEGMEDLVSEEVPLAGGEFISSDKSLKLNIDKGTYYNPVIANIKSFGNEVNIGDGYILASKLYNISIINPSVHSDTSKPVKISLEYYGDFKGGVYLLEGSKWTYLSSRVEEGFIVTDLKPNNLKSATIALLVEENKDSFHDIRGHWAKDEIEAYIRRGVINGYPDGTFRGDNHITRGEFLVLLSRVYDWDLPKDTSNNRYFADYKKFGYADREISYGYSKAYIIGYPDKHYRPNSNISYREVDIIMKRVLGDMKFSWKTYGEKIQYEKSVRSKSYDSMNNKITRAEFSYLLYKLNEKSY